MPRIHGRTGAAGTDVDVTFTGSAGGNKGFLFKVTTASAFGAGWTVMTSVPSAWSCR